MLDRVEYPQTFAQTTSASHREREHSAWLRSVTTLSPRAMRNWRASHADSFFVDPGEHGVDCGDQQRQRRAGRVARVVFLRRRDPASVEPRWQAALEAIGAIALLAYSVHTADPDPRIGIAWTGAGERGAGPVATERDAWSPLSPETGRATRGAGQERSLAPARDGPARRNRGCTRTRSRSAAGQRDDAAQDVRSVAGQHRSQQPYRRTFHCRQRRVRGRGLHPQRRDWATASSRLGCGPTKSR